MMVDRQLRHQGLNLTLLALLKLLLCSPSN